MDIYYMVTIHVCYEQCSAYNRTKQKFYDTLAPISDVIVEIVGLTWGRERRMYELCTSLETISWV